MLSSAKKEWCQYQDYVEGNIKKDREDFDNYGIKYSERGSMDEGNLCFNGRRCFVQHWSQMIKYNNLYAMTVQRALNSVDGNQDEESFATQYNNKFLSVKSASFFDINQLFDNGKTFQDYSAYKYVNNVNYCIIAGLDFAVTGDISDFTIKAVDNSFGSQRKAILLFKYVMNPNKSKSSDSVYNQLHKVFKYVQQYHIDAIIFDETGLGKSSPELFREILRKNYYTDLSESNVIGFEFKQKSKIALLDFYWGRIQNGQEVLPKISKKWCDEDTMKRLYMNAVDKIDETSCLVRHLYEHMMFARNEHKNDKNEIVVEYRQANYKFLHDDSIFASALCSYILHIKPDICKYNTKPKVYNLPVAKLSQSRWRRRR